MNITFIGGGNMAQAIIGGLLKSGVARAENLRVAEINAQARERIAQTYAGVLSSEHASTLLHENDIIVLAVKPSQVETAVKSLGIQPDAHLILSIAAGLQWSTLSHWCLDQQRLVRAMPNTPALIGQGITALYAPELSAADRKNAEVILTSVGRTVWVEDEASMDAVTAISGSGPAYVFYFMEALEQAAQELDLPADVAHTLVLQTFAGAAALAAQSPESLATLRERVTSKGGTTEAALKSMATDLVKEAIARAAHAAATRAQEIGVELAKEKA